MKKWITICICSILVIIFTVGMANAEWVIYTIALSGQQAPGVPEDATFDAVSFSSPALNGLGDVIFRGRASSPSMGITNGIWYTTSQTLGLVTSDDVIAPGTTASFSSFGSSVINTSGDFAFNANLFAIQSQNQGIWKYVMGSWSLVAREGDQAPGTEPGVVFGNRLGFGNSIATPLINAQGNVAFSSYLSVPDDLLGNNYRGIWADTDGTLQLVARSGDHAPGTADQVRFYMPIGTSVGLGLNDVGDMVFRSQLIGQDPSWLSPIAGIWKTSGGTVELVAKEGDPAPGLTSGVTFGYQFSGSFGNPVINNSGDIAFRSYLYGTGVNFTNDDSVWYQNDGMLHLLAREGDVAPGIGAGVELGGLSDPTLNGNGDMLFRSSVRGFGVDDLNDYALWMVNGGILTLLVREGDPAPGTGPGNFFGKESGNPFGQFLLNNNGMAGFTASLDGAGVDDDNNFGLWAVDQFGTMELIIREGDQIEVAPGDIRTVRGLTAFSLASGRGIENGDAVYLNNDDQLAFTVYFTDDSSGIFLASIGSENQSPIANDQTVTTDEDTSVNTTFAVTDPDGDALSFVTETVPVNGSLTLNADGSFTYAPNLNFNGSDSFTYHANDGIVDSNTATVNITVNPVNDPPEAEAGLDQVIERDSPAGAFVTLNGSGSDDIDGDSLNYEWTWNSSTASGVNPIVTLPPGLTTVTLTVTDGYLSDTDTVNITVVDTTQPEVNIIVPHEGEALQDGITFAAEVIDVSEITEAYLYLREPGDPNGVPIGYEDLPAAFDQGLWKYDFDTTLLQDGYYVILAKAIDSYGNVGWSEVTAFSVRNWAVVELLPATEKNKAGRTMPLKFALRIAEVVDPLKPFVYNEELEVRVYDAADPENILQTSNYGSQSSDYRIDVVGELYITNFKTSKTPAKYMVEIWRLSKNFLIGSFTFETVK
jgi:VCBS repeat-containing protein